MVTAKPHRSRHVGIKVMAASASWWRRSRLVTDDNSWIHQTVSDYRQRRESRMITAEVWQGGQKGFLALLAITVSTAKKGSTSNNPSSPPLPWILSYLHKISSTWPDFGFDMPMISYSPKKRNSPNRQQPLLCKRKSTFWQYQHQPKAALPVFNYLQELASIIAVMKLLAFQRWKGWGRERTGAGLKELPFTKTKKENGTKW